jgi:hypothetical protein
MIRRARASLGAALALGALVAGCDSNATVLNGNLSATTLTIYSNLPILGSDGPVMDSIVNGEIVALYDAGGRVRFRSGGQARELHISLDSLNDANPQFGAWTRGATQLTARTASSDTSTVAYIGDFDSGASAISIPLDNEYDVLQVSPGSPYLGLTNKGLGVLGPDPDTYYPYNTARIFARLAPNYRQEATATLAYMRSLGVRRLYVLDDPADPLDAEIAPLVLATAQNLTAATRPVTYITSPYLQLDQYPPAAQRVFAQYRTLFPGLQPTAYTLYGYEAMRDILLAIGRAGPLAANRPALSAAFFHLGVIHGVIGTYRILPSGNTTLDSFDGYRVGAAGQLVLVRRIS